MNNNDLVQLIRKKSRGITPDYPSIQSNMDPWEHMWAITSSYEGTKSSLACEDLHKFIDFLLQKFNLSRKEALELWEKRDKA